MRRLSDVLDPLYLPEQDKCEISSMPCPLEFDVGRLLTEFCVVLLEHFAKSYPLLLRVVDAVETELTNVELDKSSTGINLHVDVSIVA